MTASSRGLAAWACWVLILLLALAWRLVGITTTEVWRDEAVTLIHARASWLELLTVLPRVEDTPPLSFILLKVWGYLFNSEVGLRLFPVLTGVAAVALLMKAGSLLHPRCWWAVGLLAAFSHVPIHFSLEIRTYSFLFMVTAGCFVTAERAVSAGFPRRWLLGLAVLAGVAAHCHAVGLFVYPMMLAYLVCRLPAGRRRVLFKPWWHVAWVVLVLPMVWFALYWSGIHAEQGWWIRPVTWDWARQILERFFGLEPLWYWVGQSSLERMWPGFVMERLLMFGPVILVSLGLLDARLRGRVVALAVATVTFVGLVLLTDLRVPSLLDRTALPAWAPLTLLMGLGAAASPRRYLRPVAQMTVIMLAFLYAGGWLKLAELVGNRRPGSAAGFTWLRERVQPGDIIVVDPPWFEEQVVYKLGDILSADQIYSSALPVYAGSPPKHLLVRRSPDPECGERLREAVRKLRENSGATHSVFVARFGALWDEARTPGLHEILADYRKVEQHDSIGYVGIFMSRYVPEESASRAATAPAAGPGPPH